MSVVDINYAVFSAQDQIDRHINGFASVLLAESFEKLPEEVQAGGLLLGGEGKKQDIYIIMTRQLPQSSPLRDAAPDLLRAVVAQRYLIKCMASGPGWTPELVAENEEFSRAAILAATGEEPNP